MSRTKSEKQLVRGNAVCSKTEEVIWNTGFYLLFLSRLTVIYVRIWKEAVVAVLKRCVGIYLQKLGNTMKT